MTELPVITNCDNCGACCLEQAALPVSWYLGFVRLGDPSTLPDAVRDELDLLLKLFRKVGFPSDGSACVWFDQQTRRCLHYEYRPEICRTEVVPGDEACRRWRAMKNIS